MRIDANDDIYLSVNGLRLDSRANIVISKKLLAIGQKRSRQGRISAKELPYGEVISFTHPQKSTLPTDAQSPMARAATFYVIGNQWVIKRTQQAQTQVTSIQLIQTFTTLPRLMIKMI
jgi:hypothetical protein